MDFWVKKLCICVNGYLYLRGGVESASDYTDSVVRAGTGTVDIVFTEANNSFAV